MQEELADFSWTELFFGTAFLAAASRGPHESQRVVLVRQTRVVVAAG
jgi:hypothetical protein